MCVCISTELKKKIGNSYLNDGCALCWLFVLVFISVHLVLLKCHMNGNQCTREGKTHRKLCASSMCIVYVPVWHFDPLHPVGHTQRLGVTHLPPCWHGGRQQATWKTKCFNLSLAIIVKRIREKNKNIPILQNVIQVWNFEQRLVKTYISRYGAKLCKQWYGWSTTLFSHFVVWLGKFGISETICTWSLL